MTRSWVWVTVFLTAVAPQVSAQTEALSPDTARAWIESHGEFEQRLRLFPPAANVTEIIASQSPEGGWPFSSPTVEATVLAIMHLQGEDEHGDEIDRGLRWLVFNQHESGAWGLSSPSSEEDIGATALSAAALQVAGTLEAHDRAVDRAFTWTARQAVPAGQSHIGGLAFALVLNEEYEKAAVLLSSDSGELTDPLSDATSVWFGGLACGFQEPSLETACQQWTDRAQNRWTNRWSGHGWSYSAQSDAADANLTSYLSNVLGAVQPGLAEPVHPEISNESPTDPPTVPTNTAQVPSSPKVPGLQLWSVALILVVLSLFRKPRQ